MTNKAISIYDTTLRDGAQTVGISFSLQDKMQIAKSLDHIGVDYIEGGWPGSNPKDVLFFEKIREMEIGHAKIAAFGSTKRANTSTRDDIFLQALVKSKADTITIVAKGWDFQVREALNISLEENLNLIYDTVAYLKDNGFEVFLDAEHFFDGFKGNEDYSLQTIRKATDAGADMIVLCDTNGGTLPHEVSNITQTVYNEIGSKIGVHFHNDTGVAVANSLAAVLAGAISVQGTINGLGERCGNCDIITLVPNLTTKMGYSCKMGKSLNKLTSLSRFVGETANIVPNTKAPYVGENAFAHKGGIHVSAIQKDTRTYEHISPEDVGNERQVLISELSGKSNVDFKAKELGINLDNDKELAKKVLQRVKTLEDRGYQFEAADGSFELIIREATGEYKPFFNLLAFRVISEMDGGKNLACEATIKVQVGNQIEHTVANGDGPVEALDNALRKSLVKFYPQIADMHLSDYKVRVLNEKDGTASSVRVLIDQKMDSMHWGTVGVSTNIIEASWHALVDGIEYMLYKTEQDIKDA